MKLKRWVELILIALMVIISIKMFFVDEMIACLLLVLNLIILLILDWYGTLIKELNAKLSYFMNEE